MRDYADTAERFAKDTAEHEMTIRHDDGLYRHLRFRNPSHGSYWFDLITVPHALIFRGDGTSYVFDRIDDMFEFFRSGLYKDGSIHINPHYWSEKLTSDRDSVMVYSEDLFKQQVKEHVADAITDRSAPRGISRAIKDMFKNGNIGWEGDARRALDEFEFCLYAASCSCGVKETLTDSVDADLWGYRHRRDADTPSTHVTSVKAGTPFRFEDTWEWSFKDYDWWFLWACQAIVWGIAQYDAAKAAPAEGGEPE